MKSLRTIAWFFTAFGLVFAGIGAAFFFGKQDLATSGIRAQGTVIELDRSRDSDGDITYRPVIEFRDENGTRHEFTASVGSSPAAYSRGEAVEVIYEADAPGQAMVDSFTERFLMPVAFGGFGGVFAAIGLVILLFQANRRRIVERLKTSGLPIEADFLESFRDNSIKINGRSPYRVACQATHPATGKLERFESERIWVDLGRKLDGKRLRVLVDPANPDDHFVDLAEWIGEDERA